VEAGVLLVLLFNPLWVIKTRLALQGADQLEASTKYTGSWSKYIHEQLKDVMIYTTSVFHRRIADNCERRGLQRPL